jgi:hypothetical protein
MKKAKMQDTSQIFIRISGEELGPLSVLDIKKMIDGGLFNPDDFIRIAEGGVWVKAINVKHLQALFEEREKKEVAGAFENWIDQVKSGKPVAILSQNGVIAEKERIRQELAALESERNRVEAEEKAMRAADKLRVVEIERLNEERKRINAEKEQLEWASNELNAMTVSVRRRRLLPFIVSVLTVVIVLAVGIPSYYYGLYLPGKEKEALAEDLAKKQKRYDELITKLEGKQDHLAFLELELIEAKTKGNAESIPDIEQDILKTQRDIDEIRVAISEETGKGLPSDLVPDPKLSGKLEATGSSTGRGRGIEETDAVIQAVFPDIIEEYSGILEKHPTLSGSVVVNLTISTKGQVTKAEIVASDFSDKAPEFDKAIIGKIKGLEFKASKSDFTGTYIFEFRSR